MQAKKLGCQVHLQKRGLCSLNQEESQAAKPFTMLAYLCIAFSDLSLLFFIFDLLSFYCVCLFVCLAALEIRLRALYKLGKHHTAKVAFPPSPALGLLLKL